MTHQLSFPSDFETALDGVATVVHVLQRSGNHVHMVVGVHTTWDAETHEVVATETVLACDRVTVGEDVADFAGTDASYEIELAGQSLSRELLLRDVGQHFIGIDKDGVATGRTLVRNAVFIEF